MPGLVDGVLATTVASFSSPPGELLAWLGPAIGPASFEVGSDVRERFCAEWQSYGREAVEQCFRVSGPARWHADLYGLARLQLAALGVAAVYGGGEDTCADWSRFYSFRRDGNTGRMASMVWRTA